MATHDVIVIGAGVVGCAIAWNLATLGARNVLVLDARRVGEGTSAASSGILRTHYSVRPNVELALRSWHFFERFAEHLGDADASAGLVRCGYLIAAPDGPRLAALESSIASQRAAGIAVQVLDAEEASARLPLARFDDAALIGFEPDAGFADAYLVASAFARAARRLGVRFAEGVAAQGLLRDAAGRVCGVKSAQGEHAAGGVVAAMNIWSTELERWTGVSVPLRAERHLVLALQGALPYTPAMPVYKDLGSPGMFYARSYGGTQMLVSDGSAGERLMQPDTEPAPLDMEQVLRLGGDVALRCPAYAEAGLASSWSGVYDVTPDWNPVLGALPDVPGLTVAYGFSGHGFKLSPAVGRIVAQQALRLATDLPLDPYAHERFRSGRLLRGSYGDGAVS